MASDSRLILVGRIEEIVKSMVESISEEEDPWFETILEDCEGNLQNKKICWGKEASRQKFTVMLCVMSRAHELLKHGKTITRRELYYEDVNLYGCQRQVDRAIEELAVFLDISPSALPFVPSAKGLMAAGEKLFLTRDEPNNQRVTIVLDTTGVLIQRFSVTKYWGKFRSNAKFVLIVEKDAIFYRLTEENIFGRFGPFFLVTGKGYPDKATRAFVSKLRRDLRIPCFVLVDADPYGLEIASIYKWGSLPMQKFPRENYFLAIPDLILIGVLPSEIPSLGFPDDAKIPFQPKDYIRLDNLIYRISVYNDPAWIREAKALKKLDFKTEIEAVASFGWAYLCNEYLYSKILSRVADCSNEI